MTMLICLECSIRLHINIIIYSIELKWDSKITKIWYDNEMRWMEEIYNA